MNLKREEIAGLLQDCVPSQYLEDVTDSVLALIESKSDWIPVEERIPERGSDPNFPHVSDCLLLSDGEFTYYGQHEKSNYGDEFIDSNGDAFSYDGVIITHWQPLPEPPKK